MAAKYLSDSVPAGWILKYKVHRDGSKFKYYKNLKTGQIVFQKKELPHMEVGESSSRKEGTIGKPESSNLRASAGNISASATGSDVVPGQQQEDIGIRLRGRVSICYTRRCRRNNPASSSSRTVFMAPRLLNNNGAAEPEAQPDAAEVAMDQDLP